MNGVKFVHHLHQVSWPWPPRGPWSRPPTWRTHENFISYFQQKLSAETRAKNVLPHIKTTAKKCLSIKVMILVKMRSLRTLGSYICERDDVDKLDCSAAGMNGLGELHRSQIIKKIFHLSSVPKKGIAPGGWRGPGGQFN